MSSNIITDKCLTMDVMGFHEDDHPGLRGWRVEQTLHVTAPEFLYHLENIDRAEEALRIRDSHGRHVDVDRLKDTVARALGLSALTRNTN